jgi:hypothetical protein
MIQMNTVFIPNWGLNQSELVTYMKQIEKDFEIHEICTSS